MVSREELERTADNARIALSADEMDELQDDLDDILATFATLDDIDTDGVEPAFHPIELDDDLRPDESEECFSQIEAVTNSPDTNREHGMFKGPKAV